MFELDKLPTPDEFGFFAHPDLPEIEDAEEFELAILALGWEVSQIGAPQHLFKRDSCEYSLEKMKSWQPRPPAGGSWRLVGKYDTEDGPFATFVRPLLRVTACRPEDRAMLATPAGQELLRCAEEALQKWGEALSEFTARGHS